ncbi:MAG: enoyl-CoA hydratase/isomerase family protein [Phycisphaerae bacterium]|nr:enoyl-CoA hydratase/isomerase family protein [Phycisphaerae bacterium]
MPPAVPPARPCTLPSERTADGVVFLSLIPNPAKPRGGVVVLDSWLIDELLAFFAELAQGPTPTGFVLQSASTRVFVAGADLAEIDSLDDAGLDAYLQRGADAFGQIARLPCPSVAAINSSALGGGLEIAMHCDALIGVATPASEKPYRIGLPEAGLSICPGWGGTQMLPVRIEPGLAIRGTATGETWKSTEVPAGLFAETVATAAHLRDASLAWLRAHPRTTSRSHPIAIDPATSTRVRAGLEAVRPTLPPSVAATAVVEAVETGIRNGWTKAVEAERQHLIRLRHTPEARAKLDAFFAKA